MRSAVLGAVSTKEMVTHSATIVKQVLSSVIREKGRQSPAVSAGRT
jgi:hypothetical protein